MPYHLATPARTLFYRIFSFRTVQFDHAKQQTHKRNLNVLER